MRIPIEHGYISSSSGEKRTSNYAICTAEAFTAAQGERVCITFPQFGDTSIKLELRIYALSGEYIGSVSRQAPPIYHVFESACLCRLTTPEWSSERVTLDDFYVDVETGNWQESVWLNNGYGLVNADIDGDTAYPQLSVERNPGAEENGDYTLVRIRAPQDSPKESMLTLSRTDGEFTEIADRNYESRWTGVVVQSRGSGQLCPYHISFNSGAGIQDKLNVHPDALETDLKSDGIYQDGAPLLRGYGGCRGVQVLSRAEYQALEAAGLVRTDILYFVT